MKPIARACCSGRQQVDSHAVHRHVLEGSEQIDDEARHHQQAVVGDRVRDQQQRRHGGDDAELGAEHPGPPASHGDEANAIHDRTVDELQAPGQQDHPKVGADLRRAQALRRHPRRYGDGEQAVRQALRRVQVT